MNKHYNIYVEIEECDDDNESNCENIYGECAASTDDHDKALRIATAMEIAGDKADREDKGGAS